MKFVFATIAIATLGMALGSEAKASCADISGSYRPYYETKDFDVATTLSYQQIGCDTLEISATVLGKPHFENENEYYPPKAFSLNGAPAPQGPDCDDAYPGSCASYMATDHYVIKTAKQLRIMDAGTGDGTVCTFRVSHLFKGPNGDLIEVPQDPNCGNGYHGPVRPIVWPTASTP